MHTFTPVQKLQSLLITLLILSYLYPIVTAECYFPDGSLADSNYQACNATASGAAHSACCAQGDACSTTGYCFGSAGFPYRGACTDQSWNAKECCPGCKDIAKKSSSVIYHCPLNNGSARGLWCCGAQEGTAKSENGCCDRTLFDPMASGGFQNFYIPEGAQNPAPVSTSSASSTSTAPSSPADATDAPPVAKTATHGIDRSAAIGVGVGVPVGFLLFLNLAFLFWRERKRRLSAEGVMSKSGNAPRKDGRKSKYGRYAEELSEDSSRQEIGCAAKWQRQTYSGEVYEIATPF